MRARRFQRGSVYISMMVAVSIVGIMLMEFGGLWQIEQQRDRNHHGGENERREQEADQVAPDH